MVTDGLRVHPGAVLKLLNISFQYTMLEMGVIYDSHITSYSLIIPIAKCGYLQHIWAKVYECLEHTEHMNADTEEWITLRGLKNFSHYKDLLPLQCTVSWIQPDCYCPPWTEETTSF